MKLKSTKVPKLKANPVFKNFPKHLKDPKIFEETDKRLSDILKIDHEHKTATSYAKCTECQTKRVTRQTEMKKLGFQNIQQYLEWKKIMLIIKAKKDFKLR